MKSIKEYKNITNLSLEKVTFTKIEIEKKKITLTTR
jgi:hypothetical protein